MATGIVEIEGVRHMFGTDGTVTPGWAKTDGNVIIILMNPVL